MGAITNRRSEGLQINIAIVFSPNWARQVAAIEVFALFANNPPPVTLYLVSDKADDIPNMDGLCKYFGLGYNCLYVGAEMLYKKRIVSNINAGTAFTRYTLYRLLLPEIIDADRVIYLDADTVVQGNLTDLYNLDMGNNLVAGVIDYGDKDFNLKKSIGLAPDDLYINAGVLLMNLDEIRRQGVEEQWIYYVNNRSYAFPDQDIINLTCKGRIKTIDRKYNVFMGDIRVAHFIGHKPWQNPLLSNYYIWHHWIEEYGKLFGAEFPVLQEPVSAKIPQHPVLLPGTMGSRIIVQRRSTRCKR